MNRPKIFQGKEIALDLELQLIQRIGILKKRKIIPRLASIIIGNNNASLRYLNLKKKAAQRIGAEIEIISVDSNSSQEKILEVIEKFNNNPIIHGIMVQLPFPKTFTKKTRERIIKTIKPKKDVDGMRDESHYMTPAVKAVLTAIKEASSTRFRTLQRSERNIKVVVVGSKGFIGKKIVKVLGDMDYDVNGLDIEDKDLARKTKNADILISATGRKGLIKGNMIKDRAIVIDVGAPGGDADFEEVAKKASFVTPVPGGIGPLTISYLLENLIEVGEMLQKRT